jgi:hypothetical protein
VEYERTNRNGALRTKFVLNFSLNRFDEIRRLLEKRNRSPGKPIMSKDPSRLNSLESRETDSESDILNDVWIGSRKRTSNGKPAKFLRIGRAMRDTNARYVALIKYPQIMETFQSVFLCR